MEKSKLKKKNSLFNICGTIIEANNNGENIVLIKKTYKDYNLDINDLCIVKNNLIKKVDYNVWLSILNS